MANEVIKKNAKIIRENLKDDGTFPNNADLPTLIYQGALDVSKDDPVATIEEVFRANRWGGCWRNGIYPYHHYHSTAHEVLGIYSGEVKVQLGGPEGITLTAHPGDVIAIPAGVAHKNLGSSDDFACVGAYPPGQTYDMNYGKEGERPRVDENIAQVPLPPTDPVFGEDGPLMKYWHS